MIASVVSRISLKMIKYREGYKYQLAEDAKFDLSFYPSVNIKTDFIEFYITGVFVIKKGYAWDGASGPTWDDETNLQGSCLHDAGYQLMRLGLLDETVYRILFDKLFEQICLQDGMNKIRASLYFNGVHLFGEQYARQQEDIIFTVGK
ncbi:MAG: hypothetical protein A2W11_06180 [Ignavibacteria bacterium RBG_16_35_7]|nr:MAG: hypothetical protein A2W11_06180 [Ignavibacteria bacterium RBG_16_35_7]